jgi:hypothetical protein
MFKPGTRYQNTTEALCLDAMCFSFHILLFVTQNGSIKVVSSTTTANGTTTGVAHLSHNTYCNKYMKRYYETENKGQIGRNKLSS